MAAVRTTLMTSTPPHTHPPQMTTTYPSTVNVVDVRSCDEEPIRVPGAIQPYGILLVLRSSDLRILQASANVAALLDVDAESLTGTHLSVLLGEAQSSRIARAIEACLATGAARPDAPFRIAIVMAGRAARFDATIAQVSPHVLLELEPAFDEDSLSVSSFQAIVRQTLSRLRGTRTVESLARAVAEQMRVISGYDRVWVYRFHADWHGEIIGESMREGIESWLGLHYPASDIPAQARELFVEHPLRMIADVDYVPCPIVPLLNPETGQPLDLSASVLRSASPVHRQYMRNMGVQSSLVVSLVKDGALWGLVSGHNYARPMVVPQRVRTLCEFFGQAASMQLALADAIEERDRTLRARSVTSTVLSTLAHSNDAVHAILHGPTSMLDLGDASGAAVVLDGLAFTTGRVPDDAALRSLVQWLDHHAAFEASTDSAVGQPAFHTSALSAVFPAAAAFADVGSGVVAGRIGAKRGHYLLWFRGERLQVIAWAGNPEKPAEVAADDTERLSPRGSFALWEQEVRGTSEPWHESVVEAARAITAVASRVGITGGGAAAPSASVTAVHSALDQLTSRLAAAARAPANANASMDRLASRIEAFIHDLDDELA